MADLARLGTTSQGTTSFGGSNQIIDKWTTEWADAAFTADLLNFLGPLDMAVKAKTDQIMPIVNDLSDLTTVNDTTIAQVFLNHGASQDTANKAVYMHDHYSTCSISGTTITGTCPSKEEIFQFVESYYGKSLPKLRASEQGIEDYVNSYIASDSTVKAAAYAAIQVWYKGDTNSDAISLYGAYNALTTVYPAMSGTTGTQIGAALDSAGIKKEIFWLVQNVEKASGQ